MRSLCATASRWAFALRLAPWLWVAKPAYRQSQYQDRLRGVAHYAARRRREAGRPHRAQEATK